jgi:hypothetical protein
MEEKARRNVSIEDEVTTFSLHLLPLHYLYKKNDSAKKSFVHNSTAVSFIPIVLDLNCNSFGSQDLAGMCFADRGNFVWQCLILIQRAGASSACARIYLGRRKCKESKSHGCRK